MFSEGHYADFYNCVYVSGMFLWPVCVNFELGGNKAVSSFEKTTSFSLEFER